MLYKSFSNKRSEITPQKSDITATFASGGGNCHILTTAGRFYISRSGHLIYWSWLNTGHICRLFKEKWVDYSYIDHTMVHWYMNIHHDTSININIYTINMLRLLHLIGVKFGESMNLIIWESNSQHSKKKTAVYWGSTSSLCSGRRLTRNLVKTSSGKERCIFW